MLMVMKLQAFKYMRLELYFVGRKHFSVQMRKITPW